DSGKCLAGRQLKVRVVLVVAKQDVVLGASLFDQVVLEREGLDDRVGDDDFQAGDLVEESVGLRISTVCTQVVSNAISQGTGLADIDGVAGRVEVQVDPRLLWQPCDLILEFPDGHTVLCRVSIRVPEPSIIAIGAYEKLTRSVHTSD